MSWLKLTLAENSLRMAKATCVKDKESNPCSMNVAEVLICERSCPETGTRRSTRRAAMRSPREDGREANELPEVTLASVAEEANGSTNCPTGGRMAESELAAWRFGAAVATGAGSTQKRCRSKG